MPPLIIDCRGRPRHIIVILSALLYAAAVAPGTSHGQPARASSAAFSLEQVTSYPFPADLVASPVGDRIAWTFVTKGVRSLWVAEGPDFKARALVTYTPEDGQELSGLAFSGDGKYLVYVRGGDSGSNWPADRNLMPNPTSSPIQPKAQIWVIAVDPAAAGSKAVGDPGGAGGGAPVLIGEGGAPAPSPKDNRVAFEREDAIWIAPLDGSKPATRLFFARGRNGSPTWSPDGRTLAFVSTRGSLGYIGLYSADDRPIRYLAPSVSLDDTPRWSPDGQRIAFVRRPGRGGPAASPLGSRTQPWALWVADVAPEGAAATAPDKTSEEAAAKAREVWRSPDTRWGSYPRTQGGPNLAWGAGDRLVFLSYEDGWPHLYSVPVTGASGGRATLLTPGSFMVEYVGLTPDRQFAIYNANTGPDRDDIERRHLFKVSVTGTASGAAPTTTTAATMTPAAATSAGTTTAAATIAGAPTGRPTATGTATPATLTRGTGIEWAPVVTASGRWLAYFGSTAQAPGLPFVRELDAPADRAAARALAADQIAGFPTAGLVTPEHVIFKATDGTPVHAQLFNAASVNGGGSSNSSSSSVRKPALVFVHGGPPRQMLLGWHYRYYYANSYALNQYLASRGFIVLSVNYRLGIGYGYDFHYPRDGGRAGAGEYQDVLAGGRYLQTRADVDPKRIGIWGGSYGGYLTALALGRNSDVFAAGVDIHGVHNWASQGTPEALTAAAVVGDGVTRAQLDEAARVSWASSPVSAIATWKSPVLLIHGDDDRNVRVEQTVDLALRLKAAGVPFEEMIIPDDIHDFLLHRNWLRVNQATAEFFERHFKSASTGTGSR